MHLWTTTKVFVFIVRSNIVLEKISTKFQVVMV